MSSQPRSRTTRDARARSRTQIAGPGNFGRYASGGGSRRLPLTHAQAAPGCARGRTRRGKLASPTLTARDTRASSALVTSYGQVGRDEVARRTAARGRRRSRRRAPASARCNQASSVGTGAVGGDAGGMTARSELGRERSACESRARGGDGVAEQAAAEQQLQRARRGRARRAGSLRASATRAWRRRARYWRLTRLLVELHGARRSRPSPARAITASGIGIAQVTSTRASRPLPKAARVEGDQRFERRARCAPRSRARARSRCRRC